MVRGMMDDGLSPTLRKAMMVAPAVIVALFVVLLAIPVSRPVGDWLLRENHPVELLTFVFLVGAAGVSLVLARRWRRRRAGLLSAGFYLLFAVGLFVTAMEEIAWGQFFLGFEPPAFLADVNVKGETTLHNIEGLDGRTEILRVMFGVGGLIGVWLHRSGRLLDITPPTVLWPWFAIITLLATYDLANDIVPTAQAIDAMIFRLNELNEMLIGLAALLFVGMRFLESPADRSPDGPAMSDRARPIATQASPTGTRPEET